MDINEQAVETIEVSQPEQQATEAVEKPTEEAQTPSFYTPEELQGLTPTDIDIEKVDPAIRPIVENTIRDYKALQSDYTRKAQELAELKKAPATPEVYFQDPTENAAFQVYLAQPADYLSALSLDIAKYDSVVPDDGIEDYRNARKWVAYLNGVKDRFLAKRIEITEARKNQELTDNKIKDQLGEQAQEILDYGKSLGFTDKELKTRPVLLDMVKKSYAVSNATKTVQKKEVKPTPQKASTPAGGATEAPKQGVDTSKMSDDEWFRHTQNQRREELKRKYGG